MSIAGIDVPAVNTEYTSDRAVNVVFHFETVLCEPLQRYALEPNDVKLGIETITIAAKPRPGRINILADFALSDRCRTWIMADGFATYGSLYIPAIRNWLTDNDVSSIVSDRIGYTNIMRPNMVLVHPYSIDTPTALVEEVVWRQIGEFKQGEEWHEQRTQRRQLFTT